MDQDASFLAFEKCKQTMTQLTYANISTQKKIHKGEQTWIMLIRIQKKVLSIINNLKFNPEKCAKYKRAIIPTTP